MQRGFTTSRICSGILVRRSASWIWFLASAARERKLLTAGAEDLARSGALVGDLGHAGELLDAQAKAEYQRRLEDLENEIEMARDVGNKELLAKAEDERAALAHELRRAVGLAGRDRNLGNCSLPRLRPVRSVRTRLTKGFPSPGGCKRSISVALQCNKPPIGFVP